MISLKLWTSLTTLCRSSLTRIKRLTPPFFLVSTVHSSNVAFISHFNSFLMNVCAYIFRTRDCKLILHFPGIHARKTLLPESPYHVVLQVTDESLLEGYGANSVSQYRFYVVNTHWQTTWYIRSICKSVNGQVT